MEEIDDLIKFVKTFSDFTKEDEIFANQFFEIQKVKKNEILLNAGEICNHLYFVKEGLLRTFHINANGTEFTRLIVSENEFCTVLVSFQDKISSPASIQALENGTLLKINNQKFKKFIESSENAKKIYTKILEDFQNFQIHRIEFLTQFSPQEKVEIFLKENSKLEERLTDKVIASYLQITPETYSRCKKNVNS